MRMVILDPEETKRIIRRRRALGLDRYDEVWDGVYVMSPSADNQHQTLASLLTSAFIVALGAPDRATVQQAPNVSDRREGWRKNFRCPDVAVFLPGNPAEDCGAHWLGGPDFAVEILSPGDRARKKLPFYASVGVRELLLIDRETWQVELYRLQDGALGLVGRSSPDAGEPLTSVILPMTLRIVPGAPRPRIELTWNDNELRPQLV